MKPRDDTVRVGDLVWRPDSDYPEGVAVVLRTIKMSGINSSAWVTIFWACRDRSSVTDVPLYFLDHLVPEGER